MLFYLSIHPKTFPHFKTTAQENACVLVDPPACFGFAAKGVCWGSNEQVFTVGIALPFQAPTKSRLMHFQAGSRSSPGVTVCGIDSEWVLQALRA